MDAQGRAASFGGFRPRRGAEPMGGLSEGTDFEPVVDPKMGHAQPFPGSYDTWHEPPTVRLTTRSRIRNGEIVKASFYHVALGPVLPSNAIPSLTEPQVFDIVRGQMQSVRREFARADLFSGWMFTHDEIRQHGWDEAPRAGRGTPGEQLAHNFRTLHAAGKAIDREATIYVWNDMFDPYHNAADTAEPYFLVNGNFAGSWEGLPADVVILNWTGSPFGAAARRASAAFFADRGHRQILAGYYDRSRDKFYDRAWLADLEGVPGIRGVMYASWLPTPNYGDLEAWAGHVWGGAAWAPVPAGRGRVP